MATDPITMRRVESDETFGDAPVGTFTWLLLADGTRRLVCRVPDRSPRGEITTFAVPIADNGWTWDGNEDAPTLSPSIRLSYQQDGVTHEVWHGFVRAGRLEEC